MVVSCIELVMHVGVMTKTFVSFMDKLLPRRRRFDVSQATRKVCRHILCSMFSLDDISRVDKKKIKKAYHDRRTEKKKAWVQFAAINKVCGYSITKKGKSVSKDKPQILQSYFFPPGLAAGTTDPHVQLEGCMSFQQFSSFYAAPKIDKVEEGKFTYVDQNARVQGINEVQQQLLCTIGLEADKRTHVTPNVYEF
eukprot:TRINITY_DN6517_c0_g1_i1.p1 TRINITY_DN6517_c0_g1~~TRINITY_DN6517_c0_g1_i1.p1  ORF type:complete len:195 (-),score=43.18 TRINITY_DN6517_c0_g1_i1:40-624(-)